MHNNFSPEIRVLFLIDNRMCWECEKGSADVLHHIVGRGNRLSMLENSALNACPIHNHSCHLYNASLGKIEVIRRLLKDTYIFLLENGYQLSKKDVAFKKKYRKYYDKM